MSKFVIAFHGKQYFKEQNLYLGIAILTDSLEEAAKMTLDEAEGKLECMTDNNWTIWSVKEGLVLDEKSERHIIRQKRKDLQEQLDALPKE